MEIAYVEFYTVWLYGQKRVFFFYHQRVPTELQIRSLTDVKREAPFEINLFFFKNEKSCDQTTENDVKIEVTEEPPRTPVTQSADLVSDVQPVQTVDSSLVASPAINLDTWKKLEERFVR